MKLVNPGVYGLRNLLGVPVRREPPLEFIELQDHGEAQPSLLGLVPHQLPVGLDQLI